MTAGSRTRGFSACASHETTRDAETLWRTHTLLKDLEAVFRRLKSELPLRPVFHHKEQRSAGHRLIAELAYQRVQLLRRRVREQDLGERWSTLREALTSQCRVTATFQRAEPDARSIYQALNLNPAPGGMLKLIV